MICHDGKKNGESEGKKISEKDASLVIGGSSAGDDRKFELQRNKYNLKLCWGTDEGGSLGDFVPGNGDDGNGI